MSSTEIVVKSLLTAKQVADWWQLPLARVYELARQRLIPCIHLGRQVRFDEATLRAWMNAGGLSRRDSEHNE